MKTGLLHSGRRPLARRRRRVGATACRTSASDADARRSDSVGQPADVQNVGAQQSQGDWARNSLVKLMEKGIKRQADRAWQLFNFAGEPPDLKPALLAQFTRLGPQKNLEKINHLFFSIPEGSRTYEDYLNVAKSHLAAGHLEDLGRICQKAEASGHDFSCWAFCFVNLIHRDEWISAQRLYEARSPVDAVYQKKLWDSMVPLLNPESIFNSLPDLPRLIRYQANNAYNAQGPANHFIKFLLGKVLSSPENVETMSTDSLVRLLEIYESAKLLTPSAVFRVIRILQTSERRSLFVRSIVIYRAFHRLFEGREPPSAKMLDGFFSSLTRFNIPAGAEYFLREFSNFHSKPTQHAYKKALVILSRASDPPTVAKVFQQFLAHYGPIRQLKHCWHYLAPLLYVHAKIGDVSATLSELSRLRKEAPVRPNALCWNIVLTAYARANDLNGCFRHFEWMVKEGVKLQNYTFGVLMGLCANRGDIETVSTLLDKAKQRRITLTTAMLDPVVESHCRNQNYEMAERFAEGCLGVDATGSRVRMWNVLLWNYAYRYDLQAISRIRLRMETAGIQPDDMTFSAFLLSLCLLGQTDAARRMLRTLHRSGQLHVTELHYVLVLYGYVRDRNRDMVHIIWREIEARFRNPSLSARLLLLRTQLERDMRLIQEEQEEGNNLEAENVFFANAEKFLAETVASFDPSKAATKQPTPGIDKSQTAASFPAEHYESLILQYAKRGAMERVEELFNEYAKLRGLSVEDARNNAPFGLLEALMVAYIKTQRFAKVDECWQIAFRQAQEIAKPPRVQRAWLDGVLDAPDADSLLSDISELETPPSDQEEIDEDPFMDLKTQETPLPAQPSILPAYRFLLSRALSLHMRSLAYRSNTIEIDRIAAEVEKAGFPLSTFNWSTYVQMFASSDISADTLRAFSVFEEKFMPAFPGWKHLIRQRGLRHSNVPGAIDMIESRRYSSKRKTVMDRKARNYWSKMHPEFMQPTYVSLIYLASALLRARANSVADGNAELNALHAAAPKTIAAIADMPYSRDRFQGVLLRRGAEDPSPQLPQGREGFAWTGGILGVGGRRRLPQNTELSKEPLAELQEEPSEESSDEAEVSAPASPNVSAPSPDIEPSTSQDIDPLPDPHLSVDPSWSMLSYEDKFDLQAESSLSTRRRVLGTNDELMDDERKTGDTLSENEQALEDELSLDPKPGNSKDKAESEPRTPKS